MDRPAYINESEARAVAAQVALLALVTVVFRQPIVLAILAGDFALRLVAGPAVSPLARVARHAIVPAFALPPRPVPIAPKRFAQCLGLTLTAGATVGWLASGHALVAPIAAGVLAALASLEAAFGVCAGCALYNGAVRVGIIRAPTCEACDRASAPPCAPFHASEVQPAAEDRPDASTCLPRTSDAAQLETR